MHPINLFACHARGHFLPLARRLLSLRSLAMLSFAIYLRLCSERILPLLVYLSLAHARWFVAGSRFYVRSIPRLYRSAN